MFALFLTMSHLQWFYFTNDVFNCYNSCKFTLLNKLKQQKQHVAFAMRWDSLRDEVARNRVKMMVVLKPTVEIDQSLNY